MERISFQISGMSCGHCVASVKRALEKVEGARVERVDVGSADVSYNAATTSGSALEAAIRNAGYDAVAKAPAP